MARGWCEHCVLVRTSDVHNARHLWEGNAMKTAEHALETLPKLTDERRRALETLAAQPDDAVDTSDVPELTDEQWTGAARGRFYRPLKRQITARVDADILAWLKANGKGYQTRLNTILRSAMDRELYLKGRRG